MLFMKLSKNIPWFTRQGTLVCCGVNKQNDLSTTCITNNTDIKIKYFPSYQEYRRVRSFIHHHQMKGKHYRLKCLLNSSLSQFHNRPHKLQLILQRNYSTSTRNKDLPIIYLFTKKECSLCDQAKDVLKPYQHRFTLEEIDITLPENEDWYEKYKYDIPVFHMYEDFLFMHRVDTDILEKALKQHEEKVKKLKE